MNKTLVISTTALLILLCLALGLYWYLGRTGGTDLEQWIGRQIVLVVESHINPSVEFEQIDYQAPYTVVIRDLKLSTQGTPFITVARALLELAEIPKEGKPIQILRIEMDTPKLLFLAAGERGFIGWNNFLREGVMAGSAPVPQGQRFSDILTLRHVLIRGGELIYRDRDDDGTVMTLPGIEMDLQSKPVPEAPGWYRLNATIQRDPVFNLILDSRLNVDSMEAQIESIDVTAKLAQSEYESFPPEIQRFLSAHQIQGQISAHAAGTLPLKNMSGFSGSADAELREVRVTHQGLTLPLEALRLNAKWPDGPLQMEAEGFSLADASSPLLAFERLIVNMEGMPEDGAPIHIREVRLTKPEVMIRRGEKGTLSGWETVSKLKQAAGPDEPESPSSLQDPLPLVRLDAVHIDDLQLTYEDADMKPLVIEGLNVALQAQAEDGRGSQYRIQGKIERSPWLAGDVTAIYDLERNAIQLAESSLSVDFLERQKAQTTPEMDFLEAHDVQGTLLLNLSGDIPLKDVQTADVTIDLQWEDASFSVEELRLPIDRIEATVSLPTGGARVQADGLHLFKTDVQLASLDRIELDLASWPGGDDKVHLARVLVDRPMVYLKERDGGGYQGWSEHRRSGTLPGSGSSADAAAGIPFLDRVEVDRLEIRKAALSYQPLEQDETFPIEDLNLQLSTKPSFPAGTYEFVGSLASSPLVEADFYGSFNISGQAMEFDALEIDAKFSRLLQDRVPPPIESFVRDYGLRGHASLLWKGRVPLSSAFTPQGNLQASISDGRFILNEQVHFDFGKVEATLEMPKGPLRVSLDDIEAVTDKQGVFTLRHGEVDIPALPAPDRPWIISKVAMTGPKVILVSSPEGGFTGWNTLVSTTSSHSPKESSGTTNGEALDQGSADDRTLLDTIVLQKVQVDEGGLHYDDLDAETEGMNLSGIDALIELASREGTPRIHDFTARVGMRPITTIQLEGELDRSRDRLKVTKLKMEASLIEQHYTFLPPKVQEAFKEHEIRGQLALDAAFQLDLNRPRLVEGNYQMHLTEANITAGDTIFPIDRLEARAKTSGGMSDAQYEIEMLSGHVTGELRQSLNSPLRTSLTWKAQDIQIDETLRVIQDKQSQYSGLFESQGQLEFVLNALPASITGRGDLQIKQARLVHLPVIRELIGLVERVLVKRIEGQDSASISFGFEPDHLHLSSIQIMTDVVTLRGGGDVMYDGQLDLDFVAGDVGDLQQHLGILGKVFKTVDEQVGYEVTGTLSDPKVRVNRLGLLRR